VTPGQRIGPYLLEGTLGKGGMGTVFLARDPQGRQVALKVLHDPDLELIARFQREAQVLSHLDSLRIARLMDFGVHQGRQYLVQEYCAGGDLAGVLAKRGALPPEEARELTRELAAGLEAAHQAGVVHRDLKPANVLIHEGQPKLTDFGLARAKGIDRTSLTETGIIMGTPAYMAPEQLEDARAVDARADVYALGAILYELLAGRQAFRGRGVLEIADAVLEGRYPPLPSEVPADLRRVVSRAMAVEAGERYLSAQAMVLDLVADPESNEAAPSRALASAAVALVLVLSGVTAALFAGSPADSAASPRASAALQISPDSTSPDSTSPDSSLPRSTATPPPSPSPARLSATEEQAAVRAALAACAAAAQQQEGVARLRSLAEEGNSWADLALGRLYMTGYAVERDLARAQVHLGRAKAADSAEAELLLTFTHPVERWRGLGPRAEEALRERAKAGDIQAARLCVDRQRKAVNGAGEAGELKRLLELRTDLQFRALGTPGRERSLRELMARDDPEARVQQTLARLQMDLDSDALGGETRSPREVLLAAHRAGSCFAGSALGQYILKGRLPGSTEEGSRWLRQSALEGFATPSLVLWELLPPEEPARRGWLEFGARLGSPEAAAAYGALLWREGDPEARWWLEFAASLGHPDASGLLARVLHESGSSSTRLVRRVRTLALRGARAGRGEHLATLGASLLDPRGGEPDPLLGLAILSGLAVHEEDGEAAVAAARAAQAIPARRALVRPLLRRALVVPEARERAADLLREVTKGISTSAPIASQSQLRLQAWARGEASRGDEFARARRRAALIELARRARRELKGARRDAAIRRAAEAGDPESQLVYAHTLYLGSKAKSPERAEALRWYRASGLGEGLYYYHHEVSGPAAALEELRRLAKGADPEAMRFLARHLRAQDRDSQEAWDLLRRASQLGDREAQEAVLWAAFLDPNQRDATLALFRADPERHRRALGRVYAGSFELFDLRRALEHLLEAAVKGEGAKDYWHLGETLKSLREPQAALLWLLASAERGVSDAAVTAAGLMLKTPRLLRQEEALALLDPLAANDEGGQAKLSLAIGYLSGIRIEKDVPRAEALLREVLAAPTTRPRVRTRAQELLGARLLLRRKAEALGLLEAALADGDPDARIWIAHGYLYGILLPRDVPRGWRLLEEGVEKGELSSRLALIRALLEWPERDRDHLARARALFDALEPHTIRGAVVRGEVLRLRKLLEER
jgi:serine/threonine protein kinase/TPR repeat protein